MFQLNTGINSGIHTGSTGIYHRHVDGDLQEKRIAHAQGE